MACSSIRRRSPHTASGNEPLLLGLKGGIGWSPWRMGQCRRNRVSPPDDGGCALCGEDAIGRILFFGDGSGAAMVFFSGADMGIDERRIQSSNNKGKVALHTTIVDSIQCGQLPLSPYIDKLQQ